MTDIQDSATPGSHAEAAQPFAYEDDRFNPYAAALKWGWVVLLSIAVLAGISAFALPRNGEADLGDVAFQDALGQVAPVCGAIGIFVLVIHVAVLALLWKQEKP